MTRTISEFDFYSIKFKTRCGYPVELNPWDTNSPYLTGKVLISLQNGIIYEHFMTWDKCGGSINKGENPTEYYYDLKYENS